MKKSRELNMSIPEITDKIDVREISENFEIIDKILSANLFKRNTSTTEINVTAYPPYYIMKNTENNPINYFDPIFEETFTLGPLEEKKFFINAPQSVYITSDVQIEYDYFIPVQEAINDISPGGTSDYDNLDNKPQINGNVLSGDKTASELGLADINDIPDISASTINGNIKINGTETNVYTHPTGTNPHGTTKSDVGLGNVPNVATNDQTPSYTEATTLAKLASGEKLSVAFGKISKAITDLISHIGDSVKHITSTERTNWNAAKTKADTNETNISNANTQIADIYNRCGGGKNLYNFTESNKGKTVNGVTFKNNIDTTFTVSGTSTADDTYMDLYYSTTVIPSQFTKGKTYKMVISNSENKIAFQILFYVNSSWTSQISTYSTRSFTVPDNVTGMIIRLTVPAANTIVDTTVGVMITEQFINNTEVVPYVPTNAELNTKIENNTTNIVSCKNDIAINKTTLGTQCKNLLKTSLKANITKNGLTFKAQADGSVKVTGTATSNTTIDVYLAGDWKSENVLYPLDSYRIHLQHDTNTTMTITVLTYDGKTQSSIWVNNPVNGKAFTNFVTGIYITFRPITGATYDNYIYPMLTYADITDDTYEPYVPSLQEQIAELTARVEALETK